MSVKRPALATLTLALIGLAVSVMLARTHAEISSGLPTGCTINEQINCVPVLTSPYAYLFGLPVAWFALAAYAVLAALAAGAATAVSAARRRQFASLLLVGAVGAVLVSAYLAYVAFVVIGHVCPQCTSLYVVNLLLLASTTWLTSATQAATRDREAWQGRARLIAVGVLGTLAVLVAGVLWKGFSASTPLSSAEVCARDPQFCAQYRGLPVVSVDAAGGHVKGQPGAPVTVVEFSDFECGHCKLAWDGLKQALPVYGDLMRVVHHHFPLDGACNPSVPAGSGHKYACLAAMAAECAGAQGKFWEYSDLLFANQPQFSREDLVRYAADLGIDRGSFLACLDSDVPRAAVRADIAAGNALGIDSTPTIYLNGRAVRGALHGDTFGYAIVLEHDAAPPRDR